MNTKENNYSLLREFNLEQAQSGGEILSVLSYSYKEVVHEVKFKGVTSNLQEVFLEDNQGEGYCRSSDRVKMKPLCWIEGKPVYKGDKLWYKSKADNTYYQHEAWSITSDHLFDEGSFGFVDVSLLSWDKPQHHVHQELIDAWEKGAEIQYYSGLTGDGYEWRDTTHPIWSLEDKYRIKPEQKTKKSGWINLWKPSYNRHPRCLTVDNTVCSTKDVALTLANIHPDEYITTIEIHWEE